jgi:hypothetical protein
METSLYAHSYIAIGARAGNQGRPFHDGQVVFVIITLRDVPSRAHGTVGQRTFPLPVNGFDSRRMAVAAKFAPGVVAEVLVEARGGWSTFTPSTIPTRLPVDAGNDGAAPSCRRSILASYRWTRRSVDSEHAIGFHPA